MSSHLVPLEGLGTVELSVEEQGSGSPVLLLHGGAGPISVAGFARLLANEGSAHVFAPVHPGFNGTPRPEWLSTVARLTDVYAHWVAQLDLDDFTVIGNSIGGWIACELALRAPERVGRLVLVDAVGIQVDDHSIADVFSLSPAELSKLSFHNPAAFPLNPATMSDAQRASLVANRNALALYGGRPPTPDPTLRERLATIAVPTLVVWGESDRVVDPEYGRAFAAAIPGAKFRLLPKTGHVPQIETPAQLLTTILEFTKPSSSGSTPG
jgi:pimeloyl-ACP methyl ester carboxylesterase